ncbi:hypothetical protein [Phenylobacterium sp.]|uniref:hypothetical protein n=1 Tax=Phenylobacterium sp. TaxID=1871053 RepID=UPI002F3F4790
MFRPVGATAILGAMASEAGRRGGLPLCCAAFLVVSAGPLLAAPVAETAPPRVAGDPHSDPDGVSDHTSYLLFAEGSRSIDVSGSTGEAGRARASRIGLEAMLYVREGAAAYVIRDPATLRRARALFVSEDALGAQQTALSSQQATLSKLQTELAREQDRLSHLQSHAAPSDAADLTREQNALGRDVNELGRVINSLGRDISILGGSQDQLAEDARMEFQDLFAEALRRGVARRID